MVLILGVVLIFWAGVYPFFHRAGGTRRVLTLFGVCWCPSILPVGLSDVTLALLESRYAEGAALPLVIGLHDGADDYVREKNPPWYISLSSGVSWGHATATLLRQHNWTTMVVLTDKTPSQALVERGVEACDAVNVQTACVAKMHVFHPLYMSHDQLVQQLRSIVAEVCRGGGSGAGWHWHSGDQCVPSATTSTSRCGGEGP